MELAELAMELAELARELAEGPLYIASFMDSSCSTWTTSHATSTMIFVTCSNLQHEAGLKTVSH